MQEITFESFDNEWFCKQCQRICFKQGKFPKAVFTVNNTFDCCLDCYTMGSQYRKPGTQTQGGTNVAVKVQIWWDTNTGSYVMSSPYAEKLITGLKHVIPENLRHYDKTTRFWYIPENYGDSLKLIAEGVFGVGTVSFVSRKATEQAEAAKTGTSGNYIPPAQSASGYMTPLDKSILNFFRLLPYEAAVSAFKLAARALHPDRNLNDPQGAHSRMASLTEAWSVIEREAFRK
jgi:hypothetical protein